MNKLIIKILIYFCHLILKVNPNEFLKKKIK